jgi:hypothetical protein
MSNRCFGFVYLCAVVQSGLEKSPYNCLLIVCSLYGQAAVEEGIVVGGGCTLLRLAAKVDAIKENLENDEQKVRKNRRSSSFPK